jgi:hypothetical protein
MVAKTAIFIAMLTLMIVSYWSAPTSLLQQSPTEYTVKMKELQHTPWESARITLQVIEDGRSAAIVLRGQLTNMKSNDMGKLPCRLSRSSLQRRTFG